MLKLYLYFMSFLMLTACCSAILTTAITTGTIAAKDQSITETIEDVKILAQIKTALIKNYFKALYTKIKVEVDQGRVFLIGTVEKEDDALTAVQIAWDQAGVQEVVNTLTVDKNSNYFNLAQYTKDSIITNQIKVKTFFDQDIKFINYTVVTVHNIVYLFGIARSAKELKKVTSIASKINGVKKVICYVKTKEAISKN